MPMPDKDQQWPPSQFVEYFNELAVFDSWYMGQPPDESSAIKHRSQLNGGIVGAAARSWLGKPNPNEANRMHVGTAADLATLSADHLFSEMPRFVMPGLKTLEDGSRERNDVQDRIEQVISTPETHATLLEAAEFASPHGGVFLRLVWDTALTRSVLLDVVHADNAVPTFRFGQLVDVTFWSQLSSPDGLVYRHLETHAAGYVEHALWAGTSERLGRRVPFDAHDDTKWLAKPGRVDEFSRIATGVDRLTVAYIPNVRPNAKYRKKPALARLGQSDYSRTITGIFEQIDNVWSSWMRDIRLGKGRILVPGTMLNQNGPGGGASFDYERDVYQTYTGITNSAGAPAQPLVSQFLIRWEEHSETIKSLTDKALHEAGWSPGSLGGNAEGMRTATEIKSDDRLSQRTRAKKLNYWRALDELVLTWLLLEQVHYGGPTPDQAPEVKFPAESQIDMEARARTAQALRAADAASIDALVRFVNPEWDGESVDREVARIKQERGLGDVADPTKVTGLEEKPEQSDVARMQERLESGGGVATKAQADALGTLVRAGVDPDDAAKRAGLPGAKFSGMTPVALRRANEE